MASERIREGVVLLAGAGSRLATARGSVPKPLVPVRGRPLINYTLEALAANGVRTVHAVVGAHAGDVIDGLKRSLPHGLELNAIENDAWQKQNGVSVLAAAHAVNGRFFLAMGDHVFEPAIVEQLASTELRDNETALAIDRNVRGVFDIADAMKVQTSAGRVVAIGKTLNAFDAIDTGLFVATPALFRYLAAAKVNDDCSLADGVRLMASERKVRAVDIGDSWWQDVDTPEMLAAAEQRMPLKMYARCDPLTVGG